ncbi:MAG TPA: aminoacyl-tRNA hydrolase [Candidatus Paceibacterota bacterium]
MRLVVGLGNPGGEYAGTRHNAGRGAAGLLAERLGVAGEFRPAGEGRVAKAALDGVGPVEILLPDTYMNLSGKAVAAALPGRDEASIAGLIVIQDELDLPLGTVRLTKGGGDGGHNGIASVTGALGSPEYIRVRIGIADPDLPRSQMDGVDSFVLGRFREEEVEKAALAIARAAEIAEDALKLGFDAAANRWNGS